MLLNNHEKYTALSLDALNIIGDIREQISIGVTANDLCEFTNEGQILVHKPVAHSPALRGRFPDNTAIFQSHYGRLASMHVMATANNKPASDTRDELTAWFDFLNELAIGEVSITKANQLAKNNKKIYELLANGDIDFEDIIDTKQTSQVRHRAIGMMLHLIQDSYTVSHCERNDDNELVKFYFYEAQDSKKHKANDDADAKHQAILISECSTCLESVLSNAQYDYTKLLTLSSNAKNSDGGRFV